MVAQYLVAAARGRYRLHAQAAQGAAGWPTCRAQRCHQVQTEAALEEVVLHRQRLATGRNTSKNHQRVQRGVERDLAQNRPEAVLNKVV